MPAEKKSFDLDDMARALKQQFDQQIPTVAAARELSEAFYLLMVRALMEGKRIFAPHTFNMVLLPPKMVSRKTPAGEPWEGFTRPKLKTTIHAGFYRFLQEEKERLDWPEGCLDQPWVRARHQESAKAKNAATKKPAKPTKAGNKGK